MIFTNSGRLNDVQNLFQLLRNMTSFGLWVFGQYLRSAITTYSRRDNTQGSQPACLFRGPLWRSHR